MSVRPPGTNWTMPKDTFLPLQCRVPLHGGEERTGARLSVKSPGMRQVKTPPARLAAETCT